MGHGLRGGGGAVGAAYIATTSCAEGSGVCRVHVRAVSGGVARTERLEDQPVALANGRRSAAPQPTLTLCSQSLSVCFLTSKLDHAAVRSESES